MFVGLLTLASSIVTVALSVSPVAFVLRLELVLLAEDGTATLVRLVGLRETEEISSTNQSAPVALKIAITSDS